MQQISGEDRWAGTRCPQAIYCITKWYLKIKQAFTSARGNFFFFLEKDCDTDIKMTAVEDSSIGPHISEMLLQALLLLTETSES